MQPNLAGEGGFFFLLGQDCRGRSKQLKRRQKQKNGGSSYFGPLWVLGRGSPRRVVNELVRWSLYGSPGRFVLQCRKSRDWTDRGGAHGTPSGRVKGSPGSPPPPTPPPYPPPPWAVAFARRGLMTVLLNTAGTNMYHTHKVTVSVNQPWRNRMLINFAPRLSQRSVLLQQMESHLEDKEAEKARHMQEAAAAHKRNVVLLNDIEVAEKKLQSREHLLLHPDTINLENGLATAKKQSKEGSGECLAV
ncbi:hypothetical protein JRQ81_003245 [Phrynocephalus forsythii]|uniref:Uncharacterized protein n=1 Tax=Phrynocephalus forsythii TaxID=171643 RepID=A0A9Q1AXF6_9SAUR|nr:hypothetical protein JRQ81_003245 [Phrynocephalus forsythii]